MVEIVTCLVVKMIIYPGLFESSEFRNQVYLAIFYSVAFCKVRQKPELVSKFTEI